MSNFYQKFLEYLEKDDSFMRKSDLIKSQMFIYDELTLLYDLLCLHLMKQDSFEQKDMKLFRLKAFTLLNSIYHDAEAKRKELEEIRKSKVEKDQLYDNLEKEFEEALTVDEQKNLVKEFTK